MYINKNLNKVINYKILMIGTGATGSQLLPFLTQLLNNYTSYNCHKLVIADGDIFEFKNIKNQKCTLNDVSKNKAEVLAERYKVVYNELNINYLDEYLTDKEKIIEILNEDDYIPILLSCVDNNASRKLFNEVFYDENIKELIYIDSGNGTIQRNGQVVVGYKTTSTEQSRENNYGFDYYDVHTFKYKILKPVCDIFPEILSDTDTFEELTGCSQVVNKYPQNIATNVMAASTIFTILNELISFNNINTHIAYFDAESSAIDIVPVKYETCKDAIKDKTNRI